MQIRLSRGLNYLSLDRINWSFITCKPQTISISHCCCLAKILLNFDGRTFQYELNLMIKIQQTYAKAKWGDDEATNKLEGWDLANLTTRQYLLSSPINYTVTNLADHLEGISHDRINRYLREKLTSAVVGQRQNRVVEPSENACVLFEDTVLDKRYSTSIWTSEPTIMACRRKEYSSRRNRLKQWTPSHSQHRTD